jgi:hypothetical protein
MLLSTIFTTLLLPIQVHPYSLTELQYPQACMVQATIDTARIIGLPRFKTMDKNSFRSIYLNELQSGLIYSINPRKTFIKNYVKSSQ